VCLLGLLGVVDDWLLGVITWKGLITEIQEKNFLVPTYEFVAYAGDFFAYFIAVALHICSGSILSFYEA